MAQALDQHMIQMMHALRASAPWVAWARKKTITLVINQHVNPGDYFVARGSAFLGSSLGFADYLVIANPRTFAMIRNLIVGRLAPTEAQPTNQAIAEMLAYFGVPGNEKSGLKLPEYLKP